MSANNKLDNAKLALTMFISMTQAPPDQIALVSFSSAAALNQPLTIDKPALISATQALTPVGSTRIDLGLAEARTELASPRHISTHAKIIVLLTDGQQNPAGNDPVIAQANAAKAEGAIIYTIGLGTDVDAALLQQIATSLDHYYYAPTSADLEHIYQQISASIVCPDIGGTVYVDQDHNGQYAPGIDTPLSDIAVQLDGPVDSQTVSQADGRYAFVDNVSGIYTVSLVVSSIPTGYLPISPTFHVINLTSLDSLDNNFGVRAGTEMAIVFTRPQPETSSNSEIWIMAADGTNQTQLTAYAGEDRWPNLSPDRTKVVYSSYRDDRWTLWIMNSDGTNPVQLPVTGNSMAATWSPDGTRIAFTNDTEDWWETWVIDADGSHLSRLTTHGPAAGHPSWSPDGTKIIYGVEPSPMYFDLYAVNSDGSGGQALITSSAGTGFSNHFPAWAPDNTLVAVEHWAAGTYGPRELWTMNPDGSGGMSLVNDIEDNEQQLSWTRDGNWLVYSKDGQIWRVRRDGSQLTQITTSGGWEPHTSANKYISYIYLPVIENH
jgi:TolB protein